MSESQEYGYKISVIGDGGVGKTSLIKKYTKGTFEMDYVKTIGAQFSKYDKIINGDQINLIFWDIAGQEDFTFLQPLFYKESKACIIVYSLEDNDLGRESFSHINDWLNVLRKYCGDIPVVLFANKIDLINEDELNKSKIQEITNNNEFYGYFTTSAKTGQNVINAFDSLINKLYNDSKKLSSLIN